MNHYLILDLVMDIVEKEFTPEFIKEFGISRMIPTGIFAGGGHPEYKIIFNNEESKMRYMEEFDVEDL